MSEGEIFGGSIVLLIVIGIAFISWVKRLWEKREEKEQNHGVKAKDVPAPVIEEKEPIILYIPEGNIEEVYRLWDGKNADTTCILERYLFWKKIEELLPKTKDESLTWEFECEDDIMKPFVKGSYD